MFYNIAGDRDEERAKEKVFKKATSLPSNAAREYMCKRPLGEWEG